MRRWLSFVLSLALVAGCGEREDDGTGTEVGGNAIPPRNVYSDFVPAEPIRFLASRTLADDRTVRLVAEEGGGLVPKDVSVRYGDDEIGMTLRLRGHPGADARTAELRLYCAEVRLSQPVAGRRIVDDAPGERVSYGASAESAGLLAASGRLPCARMPAKRDNSLSCEAALSPCRVHEPEPSTSPFRRLSP